MINPKVSIMATALAAALLMVSCSAKKDRTLYEAEEALFSARKMNGELTVANFSTEFLERTLGRYRAIIETYAKQAGDSPEMARIVVTAAMELAELEFRAVRLGDARDDFMKAYDMASGITEARANALWSAAYISAEMKDLLKSKELYTRFTGEFLDEARAQATASMNPRYLVTPMKLAELNASVGDDAEADLWLDRAEEIYRRLLGAGLEGGLEREVRYDLLTALLQGRRWEKAEKEIAEMKNIYSGVADLPPLLFLEAKISLDGFGRKERALEIFLRIHEVYPSSAEAPKALLAAAGMLLSDSKPAEARDLYKKVAGEYASSAAEGAEALWQLALISEAEGNWTDASLNYKSVYANYPATLQGMEAPLAIVRHYDGLGESAAADAAWQRAVEQYEKMTSGQYSDGVRIMAEEYYLRTLTMRGKWKEAAARLLDLPDKYPDYYGFRGNYLYAASIHEKELGDRETALEILEKCAARYPGTDLADEAGRQIERIREGK